MASKWVKVSDGGSAIIVSPKRKSTSQVARASNRALTVRPSPLLNHTGKRKRDESFKCFSSRKSLLKNYLNFTKSGVLKHLLFSQDGQWNDFSQEVIDLVKEDFLAKKLPIEVKFNGRHVMLDILHMVEVDLKTGVQKPIAWIDDTDSTADQFVKQIQQSDDCKTLDPETVRNMFIKDVDPALKVDIVDVKKCTGDIMESKLELFLKQLEITQKQRGNANVKYAWFMSPTDVNSSTVVYGLGHDGPKLGRYGYGVHLTAVNSPDSSATICDIDEKGVRCMVLCRVILGNTELVLPGSKQFYPSDESFDSGVDNLDNPKHYVVWNMNINTHIYPEYAVTVNTSPIAQGNLNITTQDPEGPMQVDSSPSKPEHVYVEKVPCVGSSTSKAPKSPWMPFSKLFEAISDKVAPDDMKLVHILYESLKVKKTSREEFIRKLRAIVGDQILKSTISSLQSSRA
ncbi:putative WWE domain, poly(ADP-ribose) polymerase, catalytic domain, RST domain-containing protein [Helianthus debilis subsp. tardiflorus]